MKLSWLCAALLSAATFGVAPAAMAQPYDLIFNGSLAAGEDSLDLFGGNVKVGDLLSVTYRYDFSLDGVRSGAPGSYDELDTDYGFDDGAITQVTLRLDGYSYTYDPDFQASVSIGQLNFDVTTDEFDTDGASASGQSLSGDNSAAVLGIGPNETLPTLLDQASYFTGEGVGTFDTAFSSSNNSDNFIFEIGSVAVTAAPEPADWALMLLGVGLTGAALQRRRPKAFPLAQA